MVEESLQYGNNALCIVIGLGGGRTHSKTQHPNVTDLYVEEVGRRIS